jgi:tripartite-type tricarboxylate transporter receptor subunit TctC
METHMAKSWWHVIIAIALFVTGIASSQAYPIKPVRIVIPLGPGNSVEIATRLVTQQLATAFGQQFIVETQPGASGQIGIERVAKAPPDGYTLLATNDNIISLPSLQKNVSFSAIRDFSPITQMAGFPLVLIAHPSVPARSARDLILLARKTPGRLDFTSGGVGSIQHIAMELFMRTTDVRLNHIPYKGAPQAMMDVVAGQMPVAFSPSPIVAGYIKSERLRGLGIGSEQRLALLPDVLTLTEQSIPLRLVAWAGLFAPVGTPREIIARLNQEVVKALRSAEVLKAAAGFGFEIYGDTPEKFTEAIKFDLARVSKTIAQAGITPQ